MTKLGDLCLELEMKVRRVEERRPRPVDERVAEILDVIDAAESPGWFTTTQGRVAHYDTGHGVALCGVGHLVRRALGDHNLCARCDSMVAARKDPT